MKDAVMERILNDRLDRACAWLDAEADKYPNHDRDKMIKVAEYAFTLHDALVGLRSSRVASLTELKV